MTQHKTKAMHIRIPQDFQKIQLLNRKNKWVYLEIKIKFLENEPLFNSLVKQAIIS